MSRLTNDEIRNRAISIIRNLTAEENGLTHGDLGILSSFLLIERTDKDKLTHYKDLEEQGRLIELPCAVGDTVYYISGIHNTLIKSAKVEEVYYNGDAFALHVYGLTYFTLQDDEFFLIKEEAEAKLKELEGDKA